jgi:hypothetical protein
VLLSAMRIIPFALLPLIASAASLNTSGSGTINYTFCSDPTNASTCQPGTQSAAGANLHVGSAPIIGALDLTASTLYGFIFLEANANTGIIGGPPSPNIPNVVSNASVQGSAGLMDVIHFLGGPGGFLDATVSCMCFKQDDASASASFQIGSTGIINLNGNYIPGPFSGHLTTPFAMNGTIAISISGSVSATDSDPSNPFNGASFARVSAGLGGFGLTNAAGTPIVVQYYTDSGTPYLGAAGFVPEPGTWMLTGLSLLGVGRWRWSRLMRRDHAR